MAGKLKPKTVKVSVQSAIELTLKSVGNYNEEIPLDGGTHTLTQIENPFPSGVEGESKSWYVIGGYGRPTRWWDNQIKKKLVRKLLSLGD